MSEQTLSNLMHEERRFEPPAELARTPTSRPRPTSEADQDRLGVLGQAGRAARLGRAVGPTVLDWDNPPFAKWFVGGKLNAAYNCVDRHVEAGNGDRVAFHWVGEPRATPATSPTPTSRTRSARPPTR